MPLLRRHGPLLAALQIAALLLAAAPAVRAQTEAQPRLDTVTLQAGMHLIRAEVARTPQQTSTGMMFRREMGANEGMLFVFNDLEPRCFWMKNTLLPLSIAFIDDDGRITDLADMQPLSEQNHCSSRAVRFALEMNQGWFAKRGIKPGFKLKGPPFGT
ncbi:MAG: DUF192 domain-containing protein [Proteobacteria bacterium]|nr:DUF192 domain-containing protein [Pseudomonadota bacterium]